MMLKHNAFVNTQTRLGETPLYLACERGHMQLAQRLLDNHPTAADINMMTRDTWSPLMIATRHGHVDVVRLLLSKGANIVARTGAGDTCLHLAAFYNKPEVTQLLIAAQCDVNARNKLGQTPVFAAAENNHNNVLDLLLAAGADVNVQDGKGASALHFACMNGHTRMVQVSRLVMVRLFPRKPSSSAFNVVIGFKASVFIPGADRSKSCLHLARQVRQESCTRGSAARST